MKRALTFAAILLGTQSHAQLIQPYAGQWHMHSSGGYHGSLSLDGLGGCSYFLTSAFVTVQATCVIRQMDDGRLMIFGTQEGSLIGGPTYGEQITAPRTAATQPTVVHFIVDDYDADKMSGTLATGARQEKVTFKR